MKTARTVLHPMYRTMNVKRDASIAIAEATSKSLNGHMCYGAIGICQPMDILTRSITEMALGAVMKETA